MRYLVTGAQGFVGRFVVSHLLAQDQDAEVFGIGRSASRASTFTHAVRWGNDTVDAPLPRSIEHVSHAARYRYAALSLEDQTALSAAVREWQPDVVFHLASGLRGDEPSSLFKTNVEGTFRLVEALGSSGAALKKVVLASSGGVYGIPSRVPIAEDAPCNPVDAYAASKLAAEAASVIAGARHGVPLVRARLFNLVGPGQDERHICGQFVARAAAILEGLVPPVFVTGRLDTTRDFIDVRDVADGLALLAEHAVPGNVYNVASSRECSMREVLALVLDLAGLSGAVEMQTLESRANDIPRHMGCIKSIASLGYQCRYSLRQSIADLLAYYRGEVKAACRL